MEKKKVVVGVGAAVAAIASAVTLGWLRKKKREEKEVKDKKEVKEKK